MKIITTEPVNQNPPGVILEVSDREGKQLIDKGLAKAAPVPQNKMAAQSEDKSNPSPAAGAEQTLSASPVARPSVRKTATKSVAGAKPRGRPRKQTGA